MKKKDDFLSPRCTASGLDLYVIRKAILRALRDALPLLHGVVLDVGCGRMPYKSLVLSPPSRAGQYIGLDLKRADYGAQPDLIWDGKRIPLVDETVDCALATEVFEHCAEPERVMKEIGRVLRPGGLLFFTTPFLWPLHEAPHDEYRFTPYSLKRHLDCAGFSDVRLGALGGWDAALAQMIGLWVRRRRMSKSARRVLSVPAVAVVRALVKRDLCPDVWADNLMVSGLYGTARKPPCPSGTIQSPHL